MTEQVQISTLTLFKFTGLFDRLWAFGQMQFAHSGLARAEGQEFYKLMGSGGKRFSPWPDWGVYALLQVWRSEEDAIRFFNAAPVWKHYTGRSSERWTLFLRNKVARGTWDGKLPFRALDELPGIPHTLVLTRATIRNRDLWRFWKYVPESQLGLYEQPQLIYTKGVGEWPIKNMATLSIWKGEDGIREFAYRNRGHQKAIELTRKYDWYSEELFSRFQIYKSTGSWQGLENSLSVAAG